MEAVKRLREVSESELDDIIDAAWEKTFDVPTKKLPARIRASTLPERKSPSRFKR